MTENHYIHKSTPHRLNPMIQMKLLWFHGSAAWIALWSIIHGLVLALSADRLVPYTAIVPIYFQCQNNSR